MGFEDSWQVKLARSLARVRADFSFALVDAALVAITYTAALVLRFADRNSDVPDYFWDSFLWALPLIAAIHLGTNLLFGAYGHVWEYASVAEAMRLVAANVTAALVVLLGALAVQNVTGESPLPIISIALGAVLTLGGMGAIRFRSRMFSFRRRDGLDPVRTLVVGTGRAAADLARWGPTLRHPIAVVGFVADRPSHGMRKLADAPVLGMVSDIPKLLDAKRIDQVVIAAPVDEEVIQEIVDACLEVAVRLRIIPGLSNALEHNGAIKDIRDLEITDLLPRPAVSTDLAKVCELLRGRHVMVTGAGGSIGSEIVKQVLSFAPASVIALDNDETHLFEAELEWPGGTTPLIPVLCDIRDRQRVFRVFTEHRPDVVFHAAAHKHVPILESCPEEAVKTNILGTRNVLDAVDHVGTAHFVMISTDKAVDPSSVMGATKRIAEMMTQSAHTEHAAVCTSVRFGNVLGSRGSVVPTFMRQIQDGGPVTVSDPAMTRYFMTVAEAVELVLQSAALADGGEVFVLDMGEPVKIMDLAHRMIRLAGMIPGKDIDVTITGARPGEKLEEVLSKRPLEASSHPKIRIARPRCPSSATLTNALNTLMRLAESSRISDLRTNLHGLAREESWAVDDVVNLTPADEQYALD